MGELTWGGAWRKGAERVGNRLQLSPGESLAPGACRLREKRKMKSRGMLRGDFC